MVTKQGPEHTDLKIHRLGSSSLFDPVTLVLSNYSSIDVGQESALDGGQQVETEAVIGKQPRDAIPIKTVFQTG